VAKRDYSFEEIDLALTAFAIEGGRESATERLLLEAGLGDIPFSTIRNWAYRTHKDRYERIASEVEKQVRTRLADTFHRLATMSAELSEDLLNRINAELERRDVERATLTQRLADVEQRIDVLQSDHTEEAEDEMKRLVGERKSIWQALESIQVNLKVHAKLLHESAVMGGVSVEKHAMLTGRPTQIVEHDFSEVRAALESKGVRLVVGQGQVPPPSPPAPATPVPTERRLPPPADESRDAGGDS
jgi:flagellar motility protein MotE (MotC chaperone)